MESQEGTINTDFCFSSSKANLAEWGFDTPNFNPSTKSKVSYAEHVKILLK